jgi:primosomal protein PriA-like protein
LSEIEYNDMRHQPMPPKTAPAALAATSFVDVLVPVALDHAYSYRVPGDLALAPGDLVTVPRSSPACTTF